MTLEQCASESNDEVNVFEWWRVEIGGSRVRLQRRCQGI